MDAGCVNVWIGALAAEKEGDFILEVKTGRSGDEASMVFEGEAAGVELSVLRQQLRMPVVWDLEPVNMMDNLS